MNAQLTTGGKIRGIVPQTIEEVFRLATAVHKSGLAPRDMKSPEAITIAIMHGLELGLPPMQAVQRIAVVNGRPTIWGDAIPALLWSHGFKLREWDSADTSHCEITRPDGTKIERSFSDDDAKRACLSSKAGPWTQYKRRMRQMRARGFAARDGAADVLGGLYLLEEMDDPAPMRDITPQKPAAMELPDIPEEPAPDHTADARAAIATAINAEMLEHLREIFPDADWEALDREYETKMDALGSAQAAE